MMKKEDILDPGKMINCQRCGKVTPLARSLKRFCSEYCRKKEEKKRWRQRQKDKR